jgi:hypothetical protein
MESRTSTESKRMRKSAGSNALMEKENGGSTSWS